MYTIKKWKTNKKYRTKACANEQLKPIKDDLCYLAHVAQMNGEIDTYYYYWSGFWFGLV